MGIRGLTTFIQNRSHLYLEEYELHNTNIVIDGNAVACNLYKWHSKSNDCFGGDYDKYALVVKNFFKILSHCNVTPYIVFDGGYETRKVATIISRMKNKIKSAEQLNSVTEGSISVFPLFLRETFLDIVLKLNLKCVRCDFEGDTEIANIARVLNCPVLSYDSDFFIFDVLYIPFSTFELCTKIKKNSKSTGSYTYIYCKIYRVEKFLKSFGGMDKTNLPILAVLLGNDYVKRSVFSMFFRHLKMQKCHGNQSDQQKRIKSLIIWLQNESLESAVKKVLSRYKCRRRKLIADKINNAIKGYNCTYSTYLQYLGITSINSKEEIKIISDIQFETEENTIDENDDLIDNEVDSEEEISSNESLSVDVDEVCDTVELELDVPTIFLEKFRKCIYFPCFMDILTRNKYYCVPQVENHELEYSHSVSTKIISAIQAILRNNDNNSLVCIARNGKDNVKNHILPNCDIKMPTLMEIEHMTLTDRKCLFMGVLKLDNNFIENCLNVFPQSWHLFVIAIKYLMDASVITWPVVYALILSKIVLGYVDKYVGMCRTAKSFEKIISKQKTAVTNIVDSDYITTVTGSLEHISYNDSMVCLKNLLPKFQIDSKMRTSNRWFDRNIVHSMAQLQSCLLHLKYLNNLLNFPFSNFIMSETFSGTLIYNLISNFKKRSNLDNYVALLLKDCPTLLKPVKLVTEKIRDNVQSSVIYDNLPKRRKKKKRTKQRQSDSPTLKQDSSEEETLFDPSNKYSALIFSEAC